MNATSPSKRKKPWNTLIIRSESMAKLKEICEHYNKQSVGATVMKMIDDRFNELFNRNESFNRKENVDVPSNPPRYRSRY